MLYTAKHSEEDEIKKMLDTLSPQMNRHIYKILQDFKDQMNIQVLVIGKVGVGKSSLVNRLIGEHVSETGEDILRVTRELVKGTTVKNGILINICDTPGLDDADEEDTDTLQNVQQECNEIDLFLFCIKMTERYERGYTEAMKTITDVYGRDIWKKAMFVLTFSNEYEPDEKFVDKVQAWKQELKKRISKIIGPQMGNKVPVIPAGHTAPKLPDRPCWISELWIQGFRRMGFSAMVKLYITSLKRIQSNITEVHTTPETQQLIACHMTKVKVENKSGMSKAEMRIAGMIVAGVVSGAIGLAVPGGTALTYMFWGALLGGLPTADLITEYAYSDDKEKKFVNCHEEAIVRSLILAFIEEYPEYVNDDAYQKLKDEIDFNKKNKTVEKEEL